METGTAERKEHSLWNRVMLKSQIFLLALDFGHRAVFLVELDSLGNWPESVTCAWEVWEGVLWGAPGRGAAVRLGRGYGDTSSLSWPHAELWTGNGSREMSPVNSRGPGLYTLTLRSHRWGATLEEGKVVPFQLQQKVKTLWELTEMGWEGSGGRFKREGACVYLMLVHADEWQDPSQYCNYPRWVVNTLGSKENELPWSWKERQFLVRHLSICFDLQASIPCLMWQE